MGYALLVVVGIPVFALAFSATVKFLGLFWGRFETSGPGGFATLYTRMLIIAAIYVVLAMFGIGGLLGLLVMALGYKFVFYAGWVEALVIGILGGIIGWVLFVVVLVGLGAAGLALG